MPAPNLYCHAGPSLLADEAALEGSESYRCAADEDDLACENCGALVRVVYTLPPDSLQVCASCFETCDGPTRVREEMAREFWIDLEVEG